MKLVKVHKTFATGESPGGVYWRNSIGCIAEIPWDVLAKVQLTFANWRNSKGCIDESLIDEIPQPPYTTLVLSILHRTHPYIRGRTIKREKDIR